MSEPYTPAMIAHALRNTPDDRLATLDWQVFQRYPTRKIVPGAIIREMIRDERQRRART